jgi:serine/threonine protein kinase
LEALFAVLDVIHSSGILHGDIRKDNIMVPKGGQSGVRFIDFGFAHAIVDSEDCKKEQAQLQEIIDKCFLSRLDVQAVCPRMNFSN